MERFFRRNSRAINITINIVLIILCSISYILLLSLYFTQGMRTESFMLVSRGSLPPTTAVPLLGVLLTGATSALLTRSVEHSVWIRLLCRETDLLSTKRFRTDEFHQRAQWSVSPFARILYVFKGRSWLLRISGLLLFGTAILNPILLYGVRPETIVRETNTTIARSEPAFSGFTQNFDEEIGMDSQMVLASLVSMNNLSAPPSDLCGEPSCSVVARATALQAKCSAYNLPLSSKDHANITFCSTFGNTTCLSLEYSGFNFTTGSVTECQSNDPDECVVSDFAVIYGLWSSFNYDNDYIQGHAVDCKIHKGSVEIKQTGLSMPVLNQESFIRSTERMETASPEFYWEGSYQQPLRDGGAYNFRGKYVRDVPMAEYLLGKRKLEPGVVEEWQVRQIGTNDTKRVARAIEANIDMATLFAFARAPHAASLEITKLHEVNIWTYDTRVLAILAPPLLATILVLSICWRIQSDSVVIGYDPLEIARRAEEVLKPQPVGKVQDSEGKETSFMSPGGAYSALEARTPYCEVGDRTGFVDAEAEIPPLRRFHSTDTARQSGDAMVSPLDRDEYDLDETTRSVVPEQGSSAI